MPNNLYYLVNHTISQNNERIRLVEIQVNVTDNRFDHFVETIRHNNDMIERTISEYTSDLTLIGFLNQTNQNCVVRHARIPDLTDLKLSVNTCANKAAYTFYGETSVAKSQIATSKTYNLNIRSTSQTCYNNNLNYEKQMGECINNRVSPSVFNPYFISSFDFKQINEYNQYIDPALERAEKEIQRVLNLFDVISRDATECIYKIELDLGRTIKNNKETIRLCQEGLIN